MHKRSTSILLILLLLGVAARIFCAFCYQRTTNPDAGVVFLMAKHMADGTGFPIFFYNQAYMGSFEPMVSAMLCRLFGTSGFMVCLGTALFGMALLPVVYAWARDAGGRIAGLAALAYVVIGPSGFFHYQASPRGGYGATLLAGSLVIWLTARLVHGERSGQRPGAWKYGVLGLTAGLGWWSNQLVGPALLAAGLIAAVWLRTRLINWRLLTTFPAFFLGSAPFWIWNIRNGWKSFSFLTTMGHGPWPMATGLRVYFYDRLFRLLNWNELHVATQLAAGILLVATTVIFAAMSTRERKDNPCAPVQRAAAIVFILISAVIYVCSDFAKANTPRYLLPVVPAIAVMFGCMTATLVRHTRWKIGWVPLCILIGAQLPDLDVTWKRHENFERRRKHELQLADTLRAHSITNVITLYANYGLNFSLKEEFCFSDIKGDRYHPYGPLAELDDRTAVMNNAGHINWLFALGSGSADIIRNGHLVALAYRPDPIRLREIRTEKWHAVTSDGKPLPAVSDRSMNTYWSRRDSARANHSIKIQLDAATDIAAVRLVSDLHRVPDDVRLDGLIADSGEWARLSGLPGKTTRWFWSGPRPYWRGKHFRITLRHPPRSVQALRITFPRQRKRWNLMEVQLFAPAGKIASTTDSIEPVLEHLQSNGVTRVYSDRWLANRIHVWSDGRISTDLDPAIFPELATSSRAMALDPDTAIVVPQRDGLLTREMLARRDIDMRQTLLGDWLVFDFRGQKWHARYRIDPALDWTGFGCLSRGDKTWAVSLIQLARLDYARADGRDTAIARLREAHRLHPNLKPAVDMLAQYLAEAGNPEADAWAQISRGRWTPGSPAPISFANGVELIGVTVPEEGLASGQEVEIAYFWRCPPNVVTYYWSVFVHFLVDDTVVLQDDHTLLDGRRVRDQPSPEVFAERRRVVLPNIAAGKTCRMRIGLVAVRRPGVRIAADTKLPKHDGAVTLPVSINLRQGVQ